MTTGAFIDIRGDSSQARREVDSLSKSFSRLGAQVRSIASMFSQAVTGLRQMAQGFQNLGFVLTAFVSFPFTRFMSGAIESITSFEDRLVEVAKTTALPTKAIDELSGRLRDLGKTTPSAQADLAQLAAEAGRVGVAVGKSAAQAVDDIMEFVRVTDMMGIATVLKGEEAAKAFGKLIAVLEDIEIDNIENLGSAINELGQATATNEQEIVGAMLRIAPAASSIGLSAPFVAALAAQIVQLSESASRGGTKARVALEKMGLNFEKAAALIGVSSEEMRQMLDDNAAEAFMRVLEAASKSGDKIESMQNLYEVFGTTGSNAVQRLAVGFEGLNDLIGISTDAFEEGTSLQQEFNRAMTATSNIWSVVKNNVRDVAMTFMNSLLPIAKEVMSVLIPAIQDLGKVIAEMSTKQKLMIVAFGAFVSIGLPVISLLASFGFAITMVINGIVNLVGGLGSLIINLITLGTGTKLATIALSGFVAAMSGALVVGVMKATGAFDAFISKIESIISQAAEWADAIIGEFAGGLIRAAGSYLITAMNYIGNIVASFLQASSPPKTGPLSTINQWGKRLIDTYMQGFLKADFSLLDKVTGIIESVFKNMADLEQISKKAMVESIAQGRELVAQLLSTFNKTGEISEEVLSKIGELMGEAGDETVKLIRLQLRYNKSLKDLDAIRQKEKDVEEGYQAEIRAITRRTDLTEVEKMRLIKAAKNRKSLALDNLATEKKVASENVDSLKDQVDWQEQYISALQKTDNIFMDLLEAVKKTASSTGKAIKSLASKLDENLSKLLEELRVNQEMQKIYKEKGMDTKGLLREELNLRQRIVDILLKKAALGEGLSRDEQKILDDNISRIKELQKILGIGVKTDLGVSQIGESDWGLEDITHGLKKAQEEVQKFGDVLDTGREKWDLFVKGFKGEALPTDLIEGMAPAGVFDKAQAEGLKKWYDLGAKIKDAFDKVKGKLQEVRDAIERIKEAISNAASTLKERFSGAVSGMSDNSNEFLATLKRFLPVIISIIAGFKLLKWVLGIITKILGVGFIGSILGVGTASSVFDLIIGQASKLKGNILGLAETAGKIGSRFGILILKGFSGPLAGLIGMITGLQNRLLTLWLVAGGYPRAFTRFITNIAKNILTLNGIIPSAIKGIGNWFAFIKRYPLTFIDIIKSKFYGLFFSIGKGLKNVLTLKGIIPGIVKSVGDWFAFMKRYPMVFLDIIKSKFFGFFQSIILGFKNLPGLLAKAVGGGIPKIFAAIFSGGIKFLGIIKLVATGIVTLFSTIGSAIASISSFIAMITGIGGAVIAIVGIIAGVIAYMIKNWDQFRDKVRGAINMIVSALKGFVTQFKKALGIGGKSIGSLKDILGELYRKGEPIFRFISGALVEAFRALASVIAIVLPQIGAFIGSLVRGIGAVALGIIDTLSGLIKFIGGVIDAFKKADWKAIFEDLKNLKIGDALKKLFGGEVITNALKQLGSGILKIFGGILTPIIGLFKGVFNIIYNFVWTIINKLRSKLGNVKLFDWILTAIDKVRDFFTNLYNFLLGHSLIPDLINGIIDWFAKPVSFIKGVFSRIGNALSPVVNAVKSFIGYIKIAAKFISTAFKSRGVEGGLQAIYKAFGPLGKVIAPVLQVFYKLYKIIKPLFKALSGGFKSGGIKGAFEVLKKILPTLLPMIGGLIGSLITMMPKQLVALGQILVTKVLPVVWSLVTKVYEYLRANLPIWISALLAVLGDLATALWGWVTTVGLPWAIQMLTTIGNWLRTNAPIWWEAFKEILGNLISGLWGWITTSLIPWIVEAIGRIISWIKTNGPGILSSLASALGTGMSLLWGWVTRSLLPWIWEAIKAIVTWLWENGPEIIETILSVLADGMKLLWGWITSDVIPWVVSLIADVAEYIRTNGPTWLKKITEVLRTIFDEFVRWVKEDILPTISKLIADGLELLAKIGGEWFEKIKEGLTKVYNKFKDIFDSIETYITTSIKGAINTVIGTVESGINKIIEGVNSMIRKVNAVAAALGFGDNLIDEIHKVTFRRLATGGIVLKEQLAIVGDVPEAIIPLSRLETLISGISNEKEEAPKQEINIVIKDNVVRSDDDLEKILDKVDKKLGMKLNYKVRNFGRSMI